MEEYLGHTAQYWIELERQLTLRGDINKIEFDDLIQEISKLRGDLSFIKSRIEQITKII